MKVIHKTEGQYITHNLSKNSLTLNDELIIKLDKYERDEPAHIDVCLDKNKNLVMGVIPGIAELYAAQIDIPAREYVDTPTGETDEDGEPIIVPVPVPYTPDKTTLTLWGLEDM